MSVMVDDAFLPAAGYLTGPHAFDVLAPVLAAAGATLVEAVPTGVQYRPGSDLVVRYRCTVSNDRQVRTDTVLAATTAAGPPAGTVPVEAVTDDGTELRVGVWRWPFDPVLPTLTSLVTPPLAGELLAELVGARPRLEVVAYRPTERAVVRATDAAGSGRETYVKVVPPSSVSALAARHERLVAAGIPAPRVLATGDGWVALEALVGTTLRDRLKRPIRPLPPPDRFGELLRNLATVDLPDVPPVRSRLDDAPHHAAMLASVLPGLRGLLDEIVGRLAATSGRLRPTMTVHGDLHEAQLVVDDSTVTGLLDVDDVGAGDPLDDVGTLVAHLRFRGATAADPEIDEYAAQVLGSVTADHDPAAVERRIAAVLVGLATGPFRIQQPDWEHTTGRVVGLVEAALDRADGLAGR